MRRTMAAAAWSGVLLLVACASPAVSTESADEARPGSVPAPTEVSVPAAEPVETGEATDDSSAPVTGDEPLADEAAPDEPTDDTISTDGDAGDRRDPDTAIGDSLFDGLGSRDVDVVAYDVRLSYDPPTTTLTGTVGVTAIVPLDVGALSLDAAGPEVSAARVDGTPVPDEGIVLADGELLVDLPAERDDEVVVEVDYSAAVGDVGGATGLPTGWNVTLGGSHVLNQPDGGRSWLPSNDHPADKAEWRFEITVPDGLTVAANGELISGPTDDGSDDADSDPDVWLWELDEPMPTYLVQVVIGEYDIVEAEPYESVDGRLIPLTHLFPRGDADRFGPAVDTVADRLRFFEERFGPYPLERYGLAFVDGFDGGAMETQGRSMFPSGLPWDDPDDVLTELLLAHELAHQWFGNAVSPGDWGDIWLNESFATYLQWMWFDEIAIEPIEVTAGINLANRQTPGAPTGAPGVDGMFGYTVYDGGAPVLHALRQIVGDDGFLEILRRWIDVHAIGSATTDDFIAIAVEVHGEDLAGFFDLWLYSATLPDEYPS